MRNLRVANRYAKAFLGLAEENGLSDEAYEDMRLVYESFQSSTELKTLLKSPIVRTTKKLNVINAIFKGKINPLSLHYLNIITRKNRAGIIEGIAFEFLRIHRESLNIEQVRLITASEVDDIVEKKAFEVASKLTTKNIEFQRVLDPELIGGFILQVGDLQYDASVKRKLARIKRQLIDN
jgi:F-type H+-transporting ATPase subunit delta